MPMIVISAQCTGSNTSINSNKSLPNLREISSSFRLPWKIVVIGDAECGKSCLIKQFLSKDKNCCLDPVYTPTIEDSYAHNVNLPDGLSHCIEIVDTSGLYQFPAMRELNMRNGTGFMLVFDLTNEKSLQSLLEIHSSIVSVKGRTDIPIILVGNKLDLVPTEGCDLSKKASSIAANTFKCDYFETSAAKDNRSLFRVFTHIVEMILEKRNKELGEIREEWNAANNAMIRNSSTSFMRRLSVSIERDSTRASRRFSEPNPKLNTGKLSVRTETKSLNLSANGTKNSSTHLLGKKNKNCSIS